jgi:protein TonB
MEAFIKKMTCRNRLFRNCMTISLLLHLFCFGGILSASLYRGDTASSSDLKQSEVDVDISEIPPEFLGGDRNPKHVKKTEWVEGIGKNVQDATPDREDVNALSGDSEDGDGYLFAVHGDLPPMPIIRFNVNRFFPREARSARIREKLVQVRVQVDSDGMLKSAVLPDERAGYGFDEAALKIVKMARFRPGYRNGKPVKMNHMLKFKFEME